jgi:hypothetical protein
MARMRAGSRWAAAVVVWLAGAAGVSEADYVTYGPVPYTEHEAFSLPKFNPALGTLTGVTFDGSGQATTTYTSFGTGNEPNEEFVVFNVPTTDFVFSGTSTDAVTFLHTSDSIGVSVNPGEFRTVPFTSPLHPGPRDALTGLDRFVGSGTFSLTGITDFKPQITLVQGPPADVEKVGQSGSGQLSVTYQFTAVPEPSALVLTGVGATALVAWAGLRRRRPYQP